MARIELNIVALGDFKSVNSQIKALQDQVNFLNKSVATVGINANLTKQLNEANAAFKSTLLSTGQFTASTVRLKAETDKFGDALVGGKLKLTEYFRIIKAGSTNATAQMKALAMEQTKLQNSMVMSDPTKQGVLSVFTPTKINAVANATKIAANTQNLYNIAVDKGAQSLINWGKNTQWAGRQLTVGMTVPLTIFGATAMNVFKDVNNEIVRMQKVYGTGLKQPTQQVLNEIKQQVLGLSKELAASMGVAVKDTAAMAADLAATGKQGNDLVIATREAMRLQKLGEMDTQSAMQTTISLQNVYKLNTNQLAGAINFLNAVENQTSTSLQDLAAGIPKVGPIVQQLGGSFKDTAIMMVAMKEAGVPAAQSANAIKSALASLINPTKAAKDAFASYNINLGDIATSTKGNPVQMILQLQSALKGLAPLAQAQLIEKLFGKFQEARIQALITNLGAVNSQTKQAFDLANATDAQLAGIASGELKTATESTTGKFKRAVETMKADLLPVGEKIMQVATSLLNFGNSIAKVFGGLPSPVKTVLGILAAGIALSGPIIMFTGVLANFVGYLVKGLFSMKNLLNGTKTFGQLFTPEIIASQNAAQLFSQKIMEDESAVTLLNQAVKQLTISLEGMAMGMAAASGTGLAGKALAAEAGLAGGKIPFKAPKMATGGMVPGNPAHGDVYPALLQGGETVIPTKQSQRYAPFISAMLSGNLPMHHEGKGPHSHKPVAGHTAMPFTPDSPQYQEMMTKYPSLPGLEASNPGSVTVVSNLVNTQMNQRLNTDLRSGIATKEKFAAGFGSEGKLGFARSAVAGGMGEDKLTNPEIQRALKDFEAEVKKRVLSLKETKLDDQHLAKVTKDLIEEQRKTAGATGEVARALHASSQQVGQVRVNPGADYIRDGIKSGKLRKSGTMAYLNEVPVGQVRNKNGAVTDYAINQPGGYQSNVKAVKNSMSALEKSLAKQIDIESESKSASKATKRAAKNMVDGVTETLKESKPKVKIASRSMMAALLLSTAGGEYTNLASETEPGLASTSGGIFAKFNEKRKAARAKLQSRMPKMMTGKFANVGIGLGLQLAGQFAAPMINKLPGGSAINGAITGASYGAFLGPEGALAGAAIGGVIGGISKLISTEKEHQAAVKASFTASADVINMFGGTIVDQTPKIHSFAKQIGLSAESASELEKNVNAISKMDAKTSSLRQVSDLLKGQNTASSVIGTAKQFAASQVANGMDPSKVSQMISAMLTYAGKTQYLKQALKEITAETKDAETATTTWLSKLLNAAGDVSQMSSSYNSLNISQKAFVDGTYQVINQILNTNTSFEKAISLANGLTTALGNSANSYKALIIAATNNGDTALATLLAKYQASNIDLNEATLAAKVQERTDLPKGKSASWLKTKEGLDWLINTAKQQIIEDNTALKIANEKHDLLVKDVKTNQEILDDLKKTLTAAEKRLKVEQDTANALKEQQQYQLTQTDLDSQIRIAKANGDYLKANILMQEKAFNEFNFVNGKKQNPLQKEIDTLKEEIAKAKAKYDKANAKLTPEVPTLPLGPTAKTDSEMTTYLKNIDANIKAMRQIAEQKGVTGTGSSAAPFTVDNAPDFNTTNIKKSLDANGRVKKSNILKGGLSSEEQSFIELLKASIPGLHGENGGKKGSGSYVVYNGHEYYMKKLNQPNEQDSIIEIGNYVSGKAAGGPITGKGTATSDSIPAYLSNGEYVIKADAVSHYGSSFFDSVNAKKFANGGMVSPVGMGMSMGMSWFGNKISESLQGIMKAVLGTDITKKKKGIKDYLQIAALAIPGGEEARGAEIGASAISHINPVKASTQIMRNLKGSMLESAIADGRRVPTVTPKNYWENKSNPTPYLEQFKDMYRSEQGMHPLLMASDYGAGFRKYWGRAYDLLVKSKDPSLKGIKNVDEFFRSIADKTPGWGAWYSEDATHPLVEAANKAFMKAHGLASDQPIALFKAAKQAGRAGYYSISSKFTRSYLNNLGISKDAAEGTEQGLYKIITEAKKLKDPLGLGGMYDEFANVIPQSLDNAVKIGSGTSRNASNHVGRGIHLSDFYSALNLGKTTSGIPKGQIVTSDINTVSDLEKILSKMNPEILASKMKLPKFANGGMINTSGSRFGFEIINKEISKFSNKAISNLNEMFGLSPTNRVLHGKTDTNWDYLGMASMLSLPTKSLGVMAKLLESADISQFILEKKAAGFNLGGQVKLPSFDVGTNFVPNDMIAQIHKGERIIPASQNNNTMDGSTYNITINAGSNASADDIAKTVINKIKQLEKMSGVKSKVGQ